MSTVVLYSLSTLCQYVTLNRLSSVSKWPLLLSTVCPLSFSTSHNTPDYLCHYVQCCLLQSVHSLSVPQTVPFLSSASLCNCFLQHSVHCQPVPHTLLSLISVSPCSILPSKVCPLSVSTSHCTVSWFCVTMSTFVLYSLSNFCQYLTLCRFLILCRYVTAAFYSPSTVCQYVTLYGLLFLCHYVHFCLLQSVHCLSVPYTVPSLSSVSPCPLLPSIFCLLSVLNSVIFRGTRRVLLSPVDRLLVDIM
jgi:hypothetical protein